MHRFEMKHLSKKVGQLFKQFKPRTWDTEDEYGQAVPQLESTEAIL